MRKYTPSRESLSNGRKRESQGVVLFVAHSSTYFLLFSANLTIRDLRLVSLHSWDAFTKGTLLFGLFLSLSATVVWRNILIGSQIHVKTAVAIRHDNEYLSVSRKSNRHNNQPSINLTYQEGAKQTPQSHCVVDRVRSTSPDIENLS